MIRRDLLCALVAGVAASACVTDPTKPEAVEDPCCDQGGLGSISEMIAIAGDTNRDGDLSPADLVGRASWSWSAGTLFLANLDDDDGDGIADASDDILNAGGDAQDLAVFEIRLGDHVDPTNHAVTVAALGSSSVRIFERTVGVGTGWRLVAPGPFPASRVIRVGIESSELAGMGEWDGFADLQVTLSDEAGRTLATDVARARVAPWLMLANTAPTEELYISTGRYARAIDMSRDLQAANVVPVREYATDSWQEMWMQDTMEVGYIEMPGSRMYLAWQNRRCGAASTCDRFASTLLGKERGVFSVPTAGATGYGDWDDWFGNLEVTPATALAPLGRIYYGKNLSKSFKDFLLAQGQQDPVELDPTWLLIKHVDEVINFIPGNDGRPRMIVTSPRRADEVLRDGYYGPYNRGIQARIDADVSELRTAIGMSADQVIHLPQYYSAGGIADWSSPVNSVHLNGTVALGNTLGERGETQLGGTPQGIAIAASLRAVGLDVLWVNDIAYQPNHGNVHCGTNTLRTPDAHAFWTRL